MIRISFVALLLLPALAWCQSGPDTASVLTYLRANHEQLDLKSAKPPALFDDAVYASQVVLFGESHGSAEPQLADEYLFKSLYRSSGVRVYIAEVDDTKAWMLNNYLQDGKEAWLDKVFASFVADTAQWANKEYVNKYRSLRSFYLTLPPNERFRIIGIDVAQDYSLLKEHLAFIFSQSKAVKGNAYVDSLKQLIDTATRAGRGALAAFSQRFIGQLQNNMRLAGTTAKNHRQLVRLVTSLSFVQPGVRRDSIMYQNFLDAVSVYELEDEKFYGFLGMYHCLTTSYNEAATFASLLAEGESPFAGKVTSIVMHSTGSQTMLPMLAQMKSMMPAAVAKKILKDNPSFTGGRYIPYDISNDQPMMMIKGTDLLKKFSEPGSITLFRLMGEGSPYTKSKLSAEVTGFQNLKMTKADAVTTDAFQYILLFRNAKAATPL